LGSCRAEARSTLGDMPSLRFSCLPLSYAVTLASGHIRPYFCFIPELTRCIKEVFTKFKIVKPKLKG
jgi:hypothetical protein